jgi:hypothetical protein
MTNIAAHPNPAGNYSSQPPRKAQTGSGRKNPFCMKIFYDSVVAAQVVLAKDKTGKAERSNAETTGNKKPARRPVFMQSRKRDY